MELTDAVVVVTGGGSGLGRELCLGFARAGSEVVVADVDGATAAGVAEEVRALGVPGRAVGVDVTDPVGCERLVAGAAEGGRLRVLVNNAGAWSPGEQFPAASSPVWRHTLDLDLVAPMLLTQLALRAMAGVGSVVSIASSAGVLDGAYGSPEYAAAKAGLVRFTTAMAERGGGVRVSCVVPDWIGLPRAHLEWAALPEEERAALDPLVPPGDVVDSVVGLARDDGSAGRVVELWGGRAPYTRDP